jgi:hypothetical protein
MRKIFLVLLIFISINCFAIEKVWVTYEVIANFNTHTYDMIMTSDFYTNTDHYTNQVKGWNFTPHTYEYFLEGYNKIKGLQKWTPEELWNNKDLYFQTMYLEYVFGTFIINVNNQIFRTIRGRVIQDPDVERYYRDLGNNIYKFVYEYVYYVE